MACMPVLRRAPASLRFTLTALLAATSVTMMPSARAADLHDDQSRLYNLGSAALPNSGGADYPTLLVAGDFDCDGSADIAVGNWAATVSGLEYAGAVTVGYADRLLGLRANGRAWNQNSAGVIDQAERNDQFGTALAAADFDGDGCDDLAIGVPMETLGSPPLTYAGGVHVLFGLEGGLQASDDLFLPASNSPNLHGHQAGHRKGTALATPTRFTNASSLPMLAVGAPRHGSPATPQSGGVAVWRSGSSVLGNPVAFLEQTTGGATPVNVVDNLLGKTMTHGDFNGDGYDDIVAASLNPEGCPVIGIPFCDNLRGQVVTWYGAATIGGVVSDLVYMGLPGIMPGGETRSGFGDVLAVGDFDADGFDDLVVASPRRTVGSAATAGIVTILYGSSSGLRLALRSHTFSLADLGRTSSAADYFGHSLATGDFNRDGFADLAIGTPYRNENGLRDTGLVSVAYGSASGLRMQGARHFNAQSAGVSVSLRADDAFGTSLAAADFNDDGVDDLAIGLGRIESTGTPGRVAFLYGSSATTTEIRSITPNPVIQGGTVTFEVSSVRTPFAGLPLGRGEVIVSVAGMQSCRATIGSNGRGQCSMTAFATGTRQVAAHHPSIIGFRTSIAESRSLTMIPSDDRIFADDFE
ncbi:hypothetical protein ACQQ2N_05630 [Dokdonella sp. MW10]|uniref:hypothetical protein n=1 Tax=Dokdonella sp. MW10 TaxID=2992926 RepID=UPI003F7EA69C